MRRKILIPPISPAKAKRRTIVLDLDDTLTVLGDHRHATLPCYCMKAVFDRAVFHTHRRYLKEFLVFAADRFELILWTAGTKGYADVAVQKIFETVGRSDVFDHVIARDPAWFNISETSWYDKTLEQLGRPIERVIMFENAPVVVPMSNCVMVQDLLFRMREGPKTVEAAEDATLENAKYLLERWDEELDAAAFLKREASLGYLTAETFRQIQTNRPLAGYSLSILPVKPKAVAASKL